MPRQSEPAMHDVTDKELHRKEGVDPYPVPKRAEQATRDEGDLQDPATTEDAPHDRGTAPAGGYTTGVDAMKNELKREGEMEGWKRGKTQGKPAPKH
jgi:hypothetical protein